MNPSIYHKFLDISFIPAGLNPVEPNKPLRRWKPEKENSSLDLLLFVREISSPSTQQA
jgi:hypothetical protein